MSYKPEYLCDLHCHTVLSDGNDTYREIIDKASDLGMKVIAITDHDITPIEYMEVDGITVTPREYGLEKGVDVILGIEYSCDTDVEDVHIVGLGCNWKDENFRIEEENMKRSKVAGYRKLTEALCDNGIMVSWSELLENGGKTRKPEEIQRKHIFEAIAAKGCTQTWQEAKILVRDNPVYNVKREKIEPSRAIQIIHAARGLAILAHPYLIDESFEKEGRSHTREQYIAGLLKMGLDGIEAAYTYNKTSYKGTLRPEEIEIEVRDKYQKSVRIISGGSDYHNDAKKGVQNARMIGEKGITPDYFRNNRYLSDLIK